jgi:hypothetical protein
MTSGVDGTHGGCAAPAKPDNPMAKPLAALAATPRWGARARSTGAACRQPGVGGCCRWHGGKSTGAPMKSGRYSEVAALNAERLRILLWFVQELNPDVEPSGWFRPPGGDRNPVKLIEKNERLTQQVEVASRPRRRRRR